MSNITIDQLEPDLSQRLERRAAQHGIALVPRVSRGVLRPRPPHVHARRQPTLARPAQHADDGAGLANR